MFHARGHTTKSRDNTQRFSVFQDFLLFDITSLFYDQTFHQSFRTYQLIMFYYNKHLHYVLLYYICSYSYNYIFIFSRRIFTRGKLFNRFSRARSSITFPLGNWNICTRVVFSHWGFLISCRLRLKRNAR